MLKLNVNELAAAVHEASPLALPEMTKGTRHLYDKIFGPMTIGMDALLSNLDFDAFETDDIGAFNELYESVLSKNGQQTVNILKALRDIAPVCKPAVYV